MLGRYVTRQLRLWAPTAFSAVAAITPSTAVVLALVAAGSGLLLQRSDVAAAGAALAGGGLAVERAQARSARRRMRRHRREYQARTRDAQLTLDTLRLQLLEARRALAAARAGQEFPDPAAGRRTAGAGGTGGPQAGGVGAERAHPGGAPRTGAGRGPQPGAGAEPDTRILRRVSGSEAAVRGDSRSGVEPDTRMLRRVSGPEAVRGSGRSVPEPDTRMLRRVSGSAAGTPGVPAVPAATSATGPASGPVRGSVPGSSFGGWSPSPVGLPPAGPSHPRLYSDPSSPGPEYASGAGGGAGASAMPPGPRGSVSGPLAIMVDLAKGASPSYPYPPPPYPPAAQSREGSGCPPASEQSALPPYPAWSVPPASSVQGREPADVERPGAAAQRGAPPATGGTASRAITEPSPLPTRGRHRYLA